MNHHEADRNLLFGLLALQLDLIDQRQFVEACTAWAAHKRESMGSVLCGRGWISAGDRDDLDRVLRRKLERNGGDARRSLASVVSGRIGAPQDDADFEVRSVVTNISGVDPADAATTVDASPGARGPFPLVRLHASGGMGRVWVAREPALGREVALKELLPGRAADPSLRARFLREARITGQLEHPNIVPIYELSQGPEDGQTFYTMRLIRGRRLTDVIRDHHRDLQAGQTGKLGLNGLLNAFVAVCNAVAYAHSRHVVHRDLKGQNVVLGDFGEVIVLDWGLAKVVHQTEPERASTVAEVDPSDLLDLTLPGQLMGTPGYMAPEQAEGQGGSVGPVSDVYGLGAILYEILTGRRPHRDSGVDEALRQVREEEPPPARQTCPSAPPALEAVCLKAMARKPEDRYATATELAREVQRWLADEPVAAYRDPWSTRLGRWERRHRTAVAVAASLMVTATVALGISTALVGRSYRAEAEQRRRSDANGDLALGAVDHLFYGVLDDPLLRETRMDRLLRTSSRTALDFYSRLSQANPGNPNLRYRLGLAYQRLARVTLRQETAPETIGLCRRALEVLEPLARDHPSSVAYRRPIALAHAKLAEAHQQLEHPGEAVEPFRRALAVAEGIAKQSGDPADFLVLAQIHNTIGRFRHSARDWDGAISAFEAALEACRRFAGDDAGASVAPEARFQTAFSRASLGNVYRNRGDQDRAEKYLVQAKAELDESFEEAPTPEHRSEAAMTDQSLGKLLDRSGRRDRARDVFREARDHWAELAEGYRDTPAYRWGLAGVLQNLGDVDNPALHPVGNPGAARRSYQQALAIWDREAPLRPDRPLLVNERARSRFELGRLCLAREKQWDQARDYLKAARLIWEGLPADSAQEYRDFYRESLDKSLAGLEKDATGPDPKE